MGMKRRRCGYFRKESSDRYCLDRTVKSQDEAWVWIVWQVERVAMNGEDPGSAVVVLADGTEVVL